MSGERGDGRADKNSENDRMTLKADKIKGIRSYYLGKKIQ